MIQSQQIDFRSEIDRIYDAQAQSLPELKLSSVKDRIRKLTKIESWLKNEANQQRVMDALQADFKKPESETMVNEIIPSLMQVHFIQKNLHYWLQTKSTERSLLMLGLSSKIKLEPKGMVLVISPWNFPFYLSLYPILYAVAAGCTVVLKPSEYSVATSKLLAEMLGSLFDEKELAVVTGDVDVSQYLLQKKWNHIHFTGSPAVGKIVMGAAAKHLCSVTLELGGKNPCVIDSTVNLKKTAQTLIWGKFTNAGQVCIAPDMVYVEEKVKDEFVQHCKDWLDKIYGENPEKSDDFARIISKKHHLHLVELLEDALDKGANLAYGGNHNADQKYFSPSILENVQTGMKIVEEEIFGPIMPIIPFSNKEKLVELLNKQEKPLAFFIFSRQKQTINYFKNHSSSGAFVVRDFFMNAAFPEVPFGGVNNSGIGKSYGYNGFKDFCNEKPVLVRRFLPLTFIFPPYNNRVKKILSWYKRIV